MITIKLKPISINKAWQGRRFKTKEYTKWRENFGLFIKSNQQKKILPNKNGKYYLSINVYLKGYKIFDVDNCIKPILDGLVENKIITDDRNVINLTITKHQVKNENEEKIEVN